MTTAASGPQVVVVGAGPTGLAVAIGLARSGVRVRVLERRRLAEPGAGLDKPCGEGLMPDAVAHLEQLGVDLRRLPRAPFGGIRWFDTESGASVEGRFPGGPGLGVRRTVLYRALIERAQEVGVGVSYGERGVRLIEQSPNRYALVTDARRYEPAAIVGADGLRSRLRSDAGLLGRSRFQTERFGIRQHFSLPQPWSKKARPAVEVFWADRAEAYVTPVGPSEIGIALLFEKAAPGAAPTTGEPPFQRHMARFPALVKRLEGATPVSKALGTGPLAQSARAVAVRNLFLVGDAAGYVDAITGEGLAVGFGEAHHLAGCLAPLAGCSSNAHEIIAGARREYPVHSRRTRRRPELLTHAALRLSRSRRLRRSVIRGLARRPVAFDRILALHVGEGKPSDALGELLPIVPTLALALLRRRSRS